MKVDLLCVGAGTSSTILIHNLVNKYVKIRQVKKKLKILIIDKNLKNLNGGEPYSGIGSKYGFFNNPIRLSPIEFKKWLLIKKNRIECIQYLSSCHVYSLNNWMNKYKNIFLNSCNSQEYLELYLPRCIMGFYLSTIHELTLNKIKNFNDKNEKKITLKFIESKLVSLYKINKKIVSKININKKNIEITSMFLSLSIGVLAPSPLRVIGQSSNKNIIQNFYGEDGTSKIIKYLVNIKKKQSSILCFFGTKAGLLEPLGEIENIIKHNKIKLKIFAISPTGKTILPAVFKSKNKYILQSINKPISNKKLQAHQIYSLVKDEFKVGKKNGFGKYDIWTQILAKGSLYKMVNSLSPSQLTEYQKTYFNKIRDKTRFTYPEPVKIKNWLIKNKFLQIFKTDAYIILKKNNKYLIQIDNNVKFFANYLINVTGPDIANRILKYDFTKKMSSKKLFKHLYKTNNKFEAAENIFMPGQLSAYFNPSRLTLLKAIFMNSKKTANTILKNIINN